jgi:hypothetical protein
MDISLANLNNQLIVESNAAFDEIIHDMDTKLGNVIKAQEADYLKGYSIYVNEKEKELKELVLKLNARDVSSKIKDEIIYGLKAELKKAMEQSVKQEAEKQEVMESNKKLKSELSVASSELKYFKDALAEQKRNNKLLKIAIDRLMDQKPKIDS